MGTVVRLTRAAKPSKPVKTAAVKRSPKRAKRPRSLDPREAVTDRVFEIITETAEGEQQYKHRLRVQFLAPGGIAANVRRLIPQGDNFLVGLVSEQIGPKSWGPAGYGGVNTTEITSIREIVADASRDH